MNIAGICPTVERLDLVRQLVTSWEEVAGSVGTAPPLLFVCQGKDDGTIGWLQSKGYPFLAVETPLPFAQAVNLGAAQVSGADYLLLLNNDIILKPGFLDGIYQGVDADVDVLGAKLLYPDGKIQHFGKWFTLDGYPFHYMRFLAADDLKASKPQAFPAVTFACVAIRATAWETMRLDLETERLARVKVLEEGKKEVPKELTVPVKGALDEQFVNGFEDDDCCLRARELGCLVAVHPLMLATHLESQTTGHDDANKTAQWQKFSKKWLETGRIQGALGVFQGWRTP